VIPLGVQVQAGVALSLGAESITTAKINKCVMAGCVSLSEVSGAALEKMQLGKELTASFVDGTGQKIDVVMSLENFSALFKNI